MQKVKWGIIGCGAVTEEKSGPAFNLVPNSELVAVMRRDVAKAADYAKRHKIAKWYGVAEDLINDPDVNAVYVATPPESHARYAIEALKAKKPVYVEKPMALNYKECLEMNKASKAYHTPLFVAYYRRALPGFLKVKELIDGGEIGKVRVVNVKQFKSLSTDEINGNLPWRVDPKIAGGGHFFDLASHLLDYFDYLFGPVQTVKPIALNQSKYYPAEDVVSSVFLFPNNVVVNGCWCFNVPDFYRGDSIEIIGEKGVIKFACFDFIPIELITKAGTQKFDYPKPAHVQQNMVEQVVNAILGNGKAHSTGETAARTSKVLDEAVAEYYKEQN